MNDYDDGIRPTEAELEAWEQEREGRELAWWEEARDLGEL